MDLAAEAIGCFDDPLVVSNAHDAGGVDKAGTTFKAYMSFLNLPHLAMMSDHAALSWQEICHGGSFSPNFLSLLLSVDAKRKSQWWRCDVQLPQFWIQVNIRSLWFLLWAFFSSKYTEIVVSSSQKEGWSNPAHLTPADESLVHDNWLFVQAESKGTQPGSSEPLTWLRLMWSILSSHWNEEGDWTKGVPGQRGCCEWLPRSGAGEGKPVMLYKLKQEMFLPMHELLHASVCLATILSRQNKIKCDLSFVVDLPHDSAPAALEWGRVWFLKLWGACVHMCSSPLEFNQLVKSLTRVYDTKMLDQAVCRAAMEHAFVLLSLQSKCTRWLNFRFWPLGRTSRVPSCHIVSCCIVIHEGGLWKACPCHRGA